MTNSEYYSIPTDIKEHGSSVEFRRFRTVDDRIAIGPVCFPDGWRWWVHDTKTGRDIGNPNGYTDLQEAFRVALTN